MKKKNILISDIKDLDSFKIFISSKIKSILVAKEKFEQKFEDYEERKFNETMYKIMEIERDLRIIKRMLILRPDQIDNTSEILLEYSKKWQILKEI
jgi:hypothetical protein